MNGHSLGRAPLTLRRSPFGLSLRANGQVVNRKRIFEVGVIPDAPAGREPGSIGRIDRLLARVPFRQKQGVA